jgi:nucleotide-binding universal stress UspA family protein
MEKKILIAVDGSVYSSQSLEYLAALFAGSTDILFHLTTYISSSGSIVPAAEDSRNSLLPVAPGSSRKRVTAQGYLQQATEKLIRLHIAPERITSSVEAAGQNIAGAIQYQAEHRLMDSILVGRRGLNYISEMLLGSVSATLLKKCHQIPVWIIDGEVQNKHILAAIDGSLPSMLAIDHLAHIMEERTDITIFLFHCHRLLEKKNSAMPESFYPIWGKEWCDQYLIGDDHIFRGPMQLLIEAGIPESNIIILPESPDLEPAHGILQQARKHQCGTLVIGRRGDGTTKGILGGVSDRTIKHAQDIALWVVG